MLLPPTREKPIGHRSSTGTAARAPPTGRSSPPSPTAAAAARSAPPLISSLVVGDGRGLIPSYVSKCTKKNFFLDKFFPLISRSDPNSFFSVRNDWLVANFGAVWRLTNPIIGGLLILQCEASENTRGSPNSA